MGEGKIGEYEKIRQQKVLHLAWAQTPLFINTEVLGALLPGLQKKKDRSGYWCTVHMMYEFYIPVKDNRQYDI